MKYLFAFCLIACGGTDPEMPDADVTPDADVRVDAVPDADVEADADTRCGRFDFPCCPGSVCLDVAHAVCDEATNMCVPREPDAGL